MRTARHRVFLRDRSAMLTKIAVAILASLLISKGSSAEAFFGDASLGHIAAISPGFISATAAVSAVSRVCSASNEREGEACQAPLRRTEVLAVPRGGGSEGTAKAAASSLPSTDDDSSSTSGMSTDSISSIGSDSVSSISSSSTTTSSSSSSATGEPTGLHNQGNTCYLNSLLQTVFHAGPFAETLLSAGYYRNPGVCITGLQRVFYQLKTQGSPASTEALTAAMGIDPRFQQDAQEFARFLFMNLEAEAGGEQVEGVGPSPEVAEAVKELFTGTWEQYIRCTDVKEEMVWEEPFYDISVNVKGTKTLDKSIEAYCAPELLTGDNQWKTKENGKQNAKKGVRFMSFPPVLHFHLKRFEFDPATGSMGKVDSRFEFPAELNVKPWLAKDENDKTIDSGDCTEYVLNAVVMHVGGPEVGHYYAYVRPDPSTPEGWFKLDDHRVFPVSEKTVLEDAYGGDRRKGRGWGAWFGMGRGKVLGNRKGDVGERGALTNKSSAYMVQYISKDMI